MEKLVTNICQVCGGALKDCGNYFKCESCDTEYRIDSSLSQAEQNAIFRKYNAFEDAERELKLSPPRFDDAEIQFENLIREYPDWSAGYWGLLRAKFGIKFERDSSGDAVPSCYKSTYEDVRDTDEFKKAVELAETPALRGSYRSMADYIADVAEKWRKETQQYDYDVFISFKASDDADGSETADTREMQNLCTFLTQNGFRVFFSPVALKEYGIGGRQSEPYIFNALDKAQALIVYGSRKEYFTSTWVQNEWQRYLRAMEHGRKPDDSLIVLYQGFNPKELPQGLRRIQALDYASRTVYSEILGALGRIFAQVREREHSPTLERVHIEAGKVGKRNATVGERIGTVQLGSAMAPKSAKRSVISVQTRELGVSSHVVAGRGQDMLRTALQCLRIGAFDDAASMFGITIPNSVTSIGESAFSDCDRLNRITIPNSVTSIGDSAFNGCNRLTTIYYNAEAVNDLSSWSNVFHNAGSSGTGISVVFGDTVKKIPAWLFHDCGGLTSVTIGNSVTSIRDSAFEGCDGLTSVTIGNSVTSFGNGVFSDCDGLTSVYIYDVANWCKISFAGELSNPLYFAKNLYLNGVLVTDLAIPDDVTSIGDFAFSGCDGLTSVTIGNSVAIIGSSAFAGCDELASVTIGNGVTSIENGAFLDCDGLMSVYINDVTNWCKISFADYSSNPLFYAKNFYLNAVLVTALTIPDSVTSIGANAFDGCDGLTSITIPDSVTSIGASAFYNCNGLTIYCEATSLPGGWDRNWNLYGCPVVWNCKNNDLADDGYIYTVVDGIRYRLKSDVAEVTRQSSLIRGDIVLLETITYNLAVYRVTSIGPGAFTQCDGLISVAIPDSVTSIGNSAFYGCDGLTSVTIGNGVTSIGSSAFGYCSRLTSVTVGNSVTSISYSAFNSCSRLTSIVIPDSVTSIGDRAFYGCDELTIYCEATRRPWGWNQDWNSSDCPVVWGYKGNSITSE